MARRPNYGFEKRQKEIQKQAKKDEKAEKKRLRKEAALAGEDPDLAGIDAADGPEGEDEDDGAGA